MYSLAWPLEVSAPAVCFYAGMTHARIHRNASFNLPD